MPPNRGGPADRWSDDDRARWLRFYDCLEAVDSVSKWTALAKYGDSQRSDAMAAYKLSLNCGTEEWFRFEDRISSEDETIPKAPPLHQNTRLHHGRDVLRITVTDWDAPEAKVAMQHALDCLARRYR